jgi:hypothetical protein
VSKSVAVSAKSVAAGSFPMALLLALTVSAIVLAPIPALAKKGDGGPSAGSAPAAPPLCSLADLSTGAQACTGFFQGNLLSNNSSDLSAQAIGLGAIGLANWNGALVEPQVNLGGNPVVNFQTALNGVTWIGLHFGGGADSPSPQASGGVTAFYRFDAGSVNLDSFTVAYGSASVARLYSTGPLIPSNLQGLTAVPEPAAWALMILGFGAAGAVLRRRHAMVSA